MFKNILKTLKINHYIKNIIVVMPILFSMNFFNIIQWNNVGIIFIAFCMISSAVYVMNDLIDIEKDKLHPVKCKRPIASGTITKPTALALLLLLLFISTFLAFKLNIYCLLMVSSYFILNIFYSLKLKNIALIDAACIALGFIFRIIAGCFAINVLPSPLVILLTFFLSMFFTYTKRKLEIQFVEDSTKRRKSIECFDIATINQFILLNAVLSISFYISYMLDSTTIQKAGSDYLFLTVVPFTLIVFRLLLLSNISKIEDDPIHFVEKDKVLKALFVFYLVILIVVLTVIK